MIDTKVREKYKPAIGIECHVQLKTNTKLFAAVGNDARQAPPNSLISHICLGMPGALPVLNAEAVQLAMRAAFAFNTQPQKFSMFERKHYFYPDLPKGYQITQLNQPIVKGGTVTFVVDNQPKTVRLNRVQMEEDAGKNTHPVGKDYSLVDLNRAGTPLLEIVSEPDIASSAEAKAYTRELYLLMKYTGVSDCDLYHGNMRFDVNVSVSKTSGQLGTRTETKNLNSFKSVEKAVDYEIERQIELLEKGQAIVQETRGWNDAKQKTFAQRGKEEAHDYRYFPDPDLPPIEVTDEMAGKVASAMPILPSEWRKRLLQLQLSDSNIEVLLEAEVDDDNVDYLSLLENNLAETEHAKALVNWFVNIEIPLRRQNEAEPSVTNQQRAGYYRAVYELVKAGKLSSTAAKSLLSELIKTGANPQDIEKYATEQGYIQLSDASEIEKIVAQVLADNPAAVEDINKGETKVIGFLVGQVMKHSQGKANPSLATDLIKKQLGL